MIKIGRMIDVDSVDEMPKEIEKYIPMPLPVTL